MSIFDTLTEEHGVMRELVARVDHAFVAGDEKEGRRGLLVLHHALALHEEIEDLLVEQACGDATGALARALSKIAIQHAEIVGLRDETRELMERAGSPEGDEARLKVLSLLLARRLRAHFHCEETQLWPLLAARRGRSVTRSLDRRAQKGLVGLRAGIRDLDAAVAEYL